MVERNPTVYHIPKFIRRWSVGIWLDVPGVDWDEIRDLLFDAYTVVAPKALLGDCMKDSNQLS